MPPATPDPVDRNPPTGPLRIRKYANRRLYDQTGSRHLTHEELYGLVAAGHDVTVVDATSSEEITNVVLAQLLIERDPLKLAAFPPMLLHALIRTNERMLHSTVTRHLAAMLESMASLQRQGGGTLDFARDPIGAMARLAPMNWMGQFSPSQLSSSQPALNDPQNSPGIESLRELRAEVASLRAELEAIATTRTRNPAAEAKPQKPRSSKNRDSVEKPVKSARQEASKSPAPKVQGRSPTTRRSGGSKPRRSR